MNASKYGRTESSSSDKVDSPDSRAYQSYNASTGGWGEYDSAAAWDTEPAQTTVNHSIDNSYGSVDESNYDQYVATVDGFVI